MVLFYFAARLAALRSNRVKRVSPIIAFIFAVVTTGFAGVTLSAPGDGSSVSSTTTVKASASSTHRISSMIVYVDDVQKYKTTSSSLSTSISVGSSGTHNITVKAWDSSGALYKDSATVTVGGSSTSSTNWYDIEQMSGWKGCDACAGVNGAGPSATYWWKQFQNAPSLDGKATQYFLGGSTPYSNVLYSKQLINDPTQVAKPHHFVYDANFYYTNSHAAQALEFDINQLAGGKRYIWGTQCNIRAGAHWDIWDNINKSWVSTGVACTAPPTYKWNHVTIEAERTSDNKLHYISITLNGTKHYINKYYSPTSTSWNGVTVNFQMDGNSTQEDYSVWLDNVSLKYW
jgi:hypothetical protein